MSSLNLSERLASIKELHNTSMTSDDKTPTPLYIFLLLYTRTNHISYIDYMEGAKALYKYLSPISYPDIPAIYDKNCPVPRLLRGYESLELAKILAPRIPHESLESHLSRLAEADRAILFTMFNQVLPELY